MPSWYAYYGAPITIIFSILAVLVALIAVWIKEDDVKVGLSVIALICAVLAGIGWYKNIYELLNIRDKMYSNLKRSEDEVARQKMEIAALTPYQGAFERVVQSALTTPPKDGDRFIFQAVMLSIPANFSPNMIKRNCSDRAAIKDAIDPLVVQGKISAGSNPALDALMNCAFIPSAR